LLWRQGNLFGRFADMNEIEWNVQAEYFNGSKHELRAKAQWLGISAHHAQAFRLQPNTHLQASADAVPDFSIGNFGFQLRYRYKIGPESDLFVVYSRGGDSFESRERSALDVLLASTRLRSSNQFLVKLRYAL
jgi:hypothetical protein